MLEKLNGKLPASNFCRSDLTKVCNFGLKCRFPSHMQPKRSRRVNLFDKLQDGKIPLTY